MHATWQNLTLANTSFYDLTKQDPRLLLLLHQHLLSPVHRPSGLHLNLLFLPAHLRHHPATPRLHLFPQTHHLHLLPLLTAMERSWRWRWKWMMITTGSLRPLVLKKTAVGGLLYLLVLLAWRYGSNQVSSLESLFLCCTWQCFTHVNSAVNSCYISCLSHRLWSLLPLGRVRNVKPVSWIKLL